MRVLVSGATGFVGRALCLRLARDGHQVVAWVRSPERARHLLGADVELVAIDAGAGARNDDSGGELARELSTCDAIVHLAGEPVIGKRWSATQRERLHLSRVGLANRLVAAMSKSSRAPHTFVSSSAVGYYGERGDDRLGENSPAGDDFLARLCVDWEQAAQAAAKHGARVVCMRTGIVLGPEGGVLGAMRLPFQLGLGGPLGSGRQYVPWVHLDDLLEMYALALTDPTIEGPWNATAPEPVTNAEFTRALGRVLRRPAIFTVPKFALYAALGASASAPLGSQRAIPERFLGRGFAFVHRQIESALREILRGDHGLRLGPAREVPDHAYLRARRPTHVLEQTTEIRAPLAQVAQFFSKAENLGILTPPSMVFRVETPRPIAMAKGTRIDYTLRLGPFPLRWRTSIEVWDDSAGFSDAEERGPFHCWWHEHRFEAQGEGTLMRDRVFFAVLPRWIGWLGWMERAIVALTVGRRLRRIFGYRSQAMAWRFDARVPSSPLKKSRREAQRSSSWLGTRRRDGGGGLPGR